LLRLAIGGNTVTKTETHAQFAGAVASPTLDSWEVISSCFLAVTNASRAQ
jgi:hypothetical protein